MATEGVVTSITVNGNTINPSSTAHVSEDAKGRNFIYIQGYHDLTIEEKDALFRLEVQILEYVAEFTYLCRYEPEDLQRIQSLDFVKAANVYEACLKSTISLKDMVQREADVTHYLVDLILHDQPNVSSEVLAEDVAEAAQVSIDELEILPRKIRLLVHQDRLDELAALDSINRIEEVREKAFFNDQATRILQAVKPMNAESLPYTGRGQTICVADSGFDQGAIHDSEPLRVHPAFAGRVENLLTLWPESKDARDPVGHGTHVCGSICGLGTYTVADQQIPMAGTAPGAKLVVQAMSRQDKWKRWILDVPSDISTLFSTAYDLNIRIHNNSWGDKWDPKLGQMGYEAEATTIDRFVVDHEDFIIVVSAGNDARADNAGTSQIGALAAAKNCITVGATGTTRANDGQRFDSTVPALTNFTQTAIFSSRGPTLATRNASLQAVPGRIKPDIMAPGVAILSTASRVLEPDARARVRYGVSGDPDWLYMSGTSMSAPLITGCVGVLREALAARGKQSPSAALIKALLVNGAVSHSCKTDVGFDNEQGFGLVNITESIKMVESSTFIEGGGKLESTEYDVAGLRVDEPIAKMWRKELARPFPEAAILTATLAFHDAPGALLQNEVRLIVKAGGIERHGNMGSGEGFDVTNNVQKVIWKDIPGDSFEIIAEANAFTLPHAVQSFAVVWHMHPMGEAQ